MTDCNGYSGGYVFWEHPDDTGSFYSKYPPITWELEEIISDNTQVHVFGTFTSKNNNFATTFGGCNQQRYWRTKNPVLTPIIKQCSNFHVDYSASIPM